LAKKFDKPLIPVNHMEGHMLSGFAEQKSQVSSIKLQENKELKSRNTKYETLNTKSFPSLGLLVSGNHTEIVLINSIGNYQKIGETQDDSCGECFDKSGRILGLGYPAGALISKFAQENRENFELKQINHNQSVLIQARNKVTGKTYELPIAMANSGDFNFSYSGLKTAFRQLVESITEHSFDSKLDRFENEKQIGLGLKKEQIMDLCVILEAAAYRPIEIKLKKAIDKYQPKEIWLGGGVVASARLRHLIRNIAKENGLKLRVPYSKKLTTDNAAMIGVTANLNLEFNKDVRILRSESEIDSLDRDPSMSL
jgi:N6-L-threonylcarbamoyladenine synthase